MSHKKIIEKLSKLDLSNYPLKEVKKLLKQLGSFGVIITNLHPRKRILRGRINERANEFDNVSKLSYKPKKFNTTYMRASTPNETMFYGSIVPEITREGEPSTARITIINEISEFAIDLESIGEQIITFSVWEVKNKIRLLSLLHHKNFERPSEFSIKLQVEFENFLKKYPGKKEQTTNIAEFLGEQYAKIVSPDEDFNYLISACYSEIASELGLDGVLYPSVKLAGEGINVAIKPKSVSKLKLIHVGECTLYKNKKQLFVGNDTVAKFNANGTLEYEKASDDVFVSKEFGRRQVGLT